MNRRLPPRRFHQVQRTGLHNLVRRESSLSPANAENLLPETTRWMYHYDSFGNLFGVTDSSLGDTSNSAVSADGDRFAFTGRERDTDTDLLFCRVRCCNPIAGRWLSEEPLAFRGDDANLYRYVGHTPANSAAADDLPR